MRRHTAFRKKIKKRSKYPLHIAVGILNCMKNIKKKTYRNFLYVVRLIQNKGYDMEEAVDIAHKIFDQVNENMTVERLVSRILTKEEYQQEYKIEK